MYGRVSQIAYATRDLDATARALAATDGVGPFFVGEFDHRDIIYRGRHPHPIYGRSATQCSVQGDDRTAAIHVSFLDDGSLPAPGFRGKDAA